ncbi:hypothetical protein TRVL_06487 [Trypanosoma vivax]|nr:hypothetical protein TRVL_06487 [Trypanosoma vivax]
MGNRFSVEFGAEEGRRTKRRRHGPRSSVTVLVKNRSTGLVWTGSLNLRPPCIHSFSCEILPKNAFKTFSQSQAVSPPNVQVPLFILCKAQLLHFLPAKAWPKADLSHDAFSFL